MPLRDPTRFVPAPRSALRRLSGLQARILGLLGIGAIATFGVAALTLAQLRGSATESAVTMSTGVAFALADQIVHTNAPQATDEVRAASLQRFIDDLEDNEARDLEIVGTDSIIIADSNHGDIGRRVERLEASTITATIADGRPRTFVEAAHGASPPRFQVVVPVRASATAHALGALVFDYTQLRLQAGQRVEQAQQRLLWTAVLCIALLLVLGGWLGHSILSPIRRLHRAALAIALGRRDCRIGHHGTDELGDLGRTFDAMTEHLAASEAALQDEILVRSQAEQALQLANDTLEIRVIDRTALLQCANERLSADLEERQRMEAQLEQLARFDPLTSLPNRSLFLVRLEQALARARRIGSKVGLMFVDLDRFKSVNDSLGHEVGDRVLSEVAQRLVSMLRTADTVSRIGGDEFTVIVEDIDELAELTAVAEKLITGFRAPLRFGEVEVFLSLSIGIAVSPDDGYDVAELMRRADFAMYHVKADGRNGYMFHSPSMTETADSRLAIEHALHHALKRDEFRVHYQPRVCAKSGRMVGMEALLRWTSGLLGPIGPDRFVPVAEETGQIVEIGAWVIRTAFEQHAAWYRQGLNPGVLAVNVSARQLKLKDFAQQVNDAASLAGICAADVELELTESMLVADPDAATAILTELRQFGFGIAIDDFGKGHSSLMHLKRFPATKIKIDRAFVMDIATDHDDEAIAASIVALANTMAIKVTAEGVETNAQLAVLERLQCDEYQGYFFGAPTAAASFGDLLEGARRVDAIAASAASAASAAGA